MNRDCLSHCLTEEQNRQFEEQGFLIVPDALPPEMVDRLTATVDRFYEEALKAGEARPHKRWGCANIIPKDDLFMELLDWPTILPKVWGILGWNSYLYHAHFSVKPPSAHDTEEEQGWLEWHQDSARVNIEMESHPRPRLSLKVAYFLTDVSEPGRGNFQVLPGSHLSDDVPPASEVGRDPRDAIPERVPDAAMSVCVKPGTAVLFDRRLWHSRSPNDSEFTRKVLFYGYAYRWLRPKDDMTVEHLFDRCDPIRRQLLGASVHNNGRYAPTDQDVPLKMWLIEHLGEEAVAAMDRRR
jgi:hypothetical protein